MVSFFSKSYAPIPVSKFFKIVKPVYKYIQIIPDKSIRNHNSSNIAKAISNTYKTINKRIKIEQMKVWIETEFKISYIVDIKGKNACFYFLVPEVYENIIVEKVREIWPRATIKAVDKIEGHTKDAKTYQLAYKYNDALSLDVDKKTNEPLNSLLNVIEIMHQDDRVTIIYNFLPHKLYNWNRQYKQTMERLKHNKPIIRDTFSMEYIIKSTLSLIDSIINSVLEVLIDFLGGKKNDEPVLSELLLSVLEDHKELSSATKKKKECGLLDTQIAIISDSPDKVRRENNVTVVTQAYRVIDEDNELIAKKVKKTPKMEDYKFKKVDTNIFSIDEVQNFIQIPGRALLKQLGIKHINTSENIVPNELRNGYIPLGPVKYRGTEVQSYIQDNYDKGSLPLVPVGSQGAGKSTFMANYYRFANVRKEGGVVIDFIKNCEMSQEVIKYLPNDDMIILDYTDPKHMQGFAFNEFKISADMDSFKKIEMSNLQAQQVLTFVNSINPEQPLQARMRKYLSAAANVVFATGENSLKEVERCLEDYNARKFFISELKEEEKEFLQDELRYLAELDDYSKPTKDNPIPQLIGTKSDRIDGILDRISLLKEDLKLKHMFNKGGKDNIDFAKELESGKVIIIRMPQDSFKKHAKNVIITFLVSKIWIATEIRGSWNKRPKPTHIAIDEVFQTKTAMQMLANDEILPQTRKFGCKFIFSCQGTEQIDIIMDTLIDAGASFMFLTGTSEKDFKKFESKLEGYEYEDLKDMEQYSSLNLIYYSGGYASFISKLPPPIKH